MGLAAVWAGSASPAVDPVSNWNTIAVQATLTAGENAVAQSRTLAIVHVAIHDALNSIDSRYERYALHRRLCKPGRQWTRRSRRRRAIHSLAQSRSALAVSPQFGTPALQALAVAQVNAAYATALAGIPDGPRRQPALWSDKPQQQRFSRLEAAITPPLWCPIRPGTQPGDWQPTPNPIPFDPPAAADHLPAALPGWGHVTPFVLRRSTHFEPDGPPRLSGKRYARDYNEVKAIGEKNTAIRTAEQTSIARFWYENSSAGVESNRHLRCGFTGSRPLGYGASARARQSRGG